MIPVKEKFNLVNWEIVSVNPSDKNWNWSDIFCFWAVNFQSLIGFSLIASLYLVYDLNFFVVFFGGLIATFFTILFSNLIGKPSQKYGLPFPVILRTSFGLNGARYIGLLRGSVGIFMFGVQTFFIAKAIGYLVRIFLFSQQGNLLDNNIFLLFFMGMNIIDWASFFFALIIQFFLFSKGQNFTRSIIKFSAYFVYFGLFIFFTLTVGENYQSVINSAKIVLNFENFISKSNLLPLLTVAGTLFAYFSILLVNFGDFSRYVKTEKELNLGNISLILNFVLISFFAIFIVIGSDIILIKNDISVEGLLTNPNDIIGKLDNSFLTVIVLFFILVASSSTNLIANYIPSQNSLINFLPKKLSLKSSGYIILLLSFFVGILWLPLLSKIGVLSLVDTVGSFFGPIFGVVIADYFLIRNSNINSKDLFSSKPNSTYYYSNGWQIKGLYSIFIGFIFAAATIWNVNLNFLQTFSWIIGAIISFIIYYLLSSD